MNYILITLLLIAAPTQTQKADIALIASAGENIDGLALSYPQGLAVNARNEEFLVADALNNRIVIFDTTGTAVFSFALSNGQQNPFGIAVNSSDEIIVSSADFPELWIYDFSGRLVNTLLLPPGIMPGRLITNKQDDIYLIDRAGSGIVVLDRTGKDINLIQSADPDCKPSGVCFDMQRNILLLSAKGKVVTAFDSEGNQLYTFGMHGRRPEDFSYPTSLAVDGQERVWIVDSFRHHIKRFDKNHKFIDIIGRAGRGVGEFHFPVDIKITPKGKLGVLEKGLGRLQIFRLKDDK